MEPYPIWFPSFCFSIKVIPKKTFIYSLTGNHGNRRENDLLCEGENFWNLKKLNLSKLSFENCLGIFAVFWFIDKMAVILGTQESMGESNKVAQNRAALFDMTFLMLVYTVQCFSTSILSPGKYIF